MDRTSRSVLLYMAQNNGARTLGTQQQAIFSPQGRIENSRRASYLRSFGVGGISASAYPRRLQNPALISLHTKIQRARLFWPNSCSTHGGCRGVNFSRSCFYFFFTRKQIRRTRRERSGPKAKGEGSN